jgi:hypothetical protein
VDQIKERLQNAFRPFKLRLSDGRAYTAPHRDFIAVTSRVVVVIDEKEISHVINALHIASISEATHKG